MPRLGTLQVTVRSALILHRWLCGGCDLDVRSFDHDVKSESGSRERLAVSAVAAVDEDWLFIQGVCDCLAEAASRHWVLCHCRIPNFYSIWNWQKADIFWLKVLVGMSSLRHLNAYVRSEPHRPYLQMKALCKAAAQATSDFSISQSQRDCHWV